MTASHDVLHERLAMVADLRDETRHSLRLWRWVFYCVGIGAVVAAAIAGAASLADFWGARTAGLLSLLAAVLTAVEKFLTAGDKVALLERRFHGLAALGERCRIAVVDEPRLRAAGSGAHEAPSDAYEAWLDRTCHEVDAELQRIETRLGSV